MSGNSTVTYIRSAARYAIAMLIPGPAAATQIMSRRGWRKRAKLTGTGFA